MPSCTINIATPIIENTTFQVSGSLIGYSIAPTLQYQDNSGIWNSLPVGANVSQTLFTFSHPGMAPIIGATVSIRDQNLTTVTATSSPFTVPAIAVESSQGESITEQSPTPIFDMDLNAYDLIMSAAFGYQMSINTVIDLTTANIAMVLYYNHQVFYENTDGNFYTKLDSSTVWRQTTDPRISIPKSCTVIVPSTIIANIAFPISGTLVSYTITPVLQYQDNNGTWLALPNHSNTTTVTFQFTHPGVAAQDSFTISIRDSNITNVNITSSAIDVVNSPESTEGSSIQPGSNQALTDSLGNFWTVSLDGIVSLNGIADLTTMDAIILYYSNHIIYYQNVNQAWFKKTNLTTQWILTTSPYLNDPGSVAFNIEASSQSLAFIVSTLEGLLAQLPPLPPTNNTRIWSNILGGDRSLLTTPFQTTATWITSGPLISQLQGLTAATVQSFATTGFVSPFWISSSTSDVLCTFHDDTSTIADFQMYVPVGAYSENGGAAGDNSAGFIDTSIPYKYVTINDCRIGSNAGNATAAGVVSTINNYIMCGPGGGSPGGMIVQDATGPVLMDAITGSVSLTVWENSDNVSGCITYYDLQQCVADASYVIQHLVAVNLDTSVYSSSGQCLWPLVISDNPGGGLIPEGVIIGIPTSTARPVGQTRPFYALFDLFQQFGGIFNNVTSGNQIAIKAMPMDSATTAFVAHMNMQFLNVLPYLRILNYGSGIAGAQYGLSTLKGRLANATGWSDAFTPPPTLNFAFTHGPQLPSTFGAWQAANGLVEVYNTIWTNE